MARVLVACEYSGEVRRAFEAHGHEVLSVDLLPADDGQNLRPDGTGHYTGPVEHVLEDPLRFGRWDLMVAFPPCTHLSVSGARWHAEKRADGRQQQALAFVRYLMAAPVPHIAIENPVSVISSHIRRPDQTIQPWQFGHGETKRTCLWLTDLPKLEPTDVVDGREQRVWRMGPSPERWKERSKTFAGIARAMADQWGPYVQRKVDAR